MLKDGSEIVSLVLCYCVILSLSDKIWGMPSMLMIIIIWCEKCAVPGTYSEKEHYHGQDDIKSAAPFFNQSNCVIYALIQSEMEPQTSGPSVRDNAIFKTMCGARSCYWVRWPSLVIFLHHNTHNYIPRDPSTSQRSNVNITGCLKTQHRACALNTKYLYRPIALIYLLDHPV